MFVHRYSFMFNCFICTMIAPYDPNKQVLTDRLMKPCGQHWFGTDDLGRDIFSRIIYGCRVSLSVGIISQIIATVLVIQWVFVLDILVEK